MNSGLGVQISPDQQSITMMLVTQCAGNSAWLECLSDEQKVGSPNLSPRTGDCGVNPKAYAWVSRVWRTRRRDRESSRSAVSTIRQFQESHLSHDGLPNCLQFGWWCNCCTVLMRGFSTREPCQEDWTEEAHMTSTRPPDQVDFVDSFGYNISCLKKILK